MYQPSGTSSGGSSAPSCNLPDGPADQADSLRNTAAGAVHQAADKAGELREQTREKLHQVADEARHQAGALIQRAKEQSGALAHEQKQLAAQGISSFAAAVHDVADRLRAEGNHNLAGYAEDMTAQLERAGRYIDQRDLRGMLDDLGNLIRRRPGVFFGSLFVAGLAAARFLKSSRRAQYEETRFAGSGYGGVDYGRVGEEGFSPDTGETFGDISGTPADAGTSPSQSANPGVSSSPDAAQTPSACSVDNPDFVRPGEEPFPNRSRSDAGF